MTYNSNPSLSRGVQPSFALRVRARITSDRLKVKRIETPGNGLLVDAALGASRFTQDVPVQIAEPFGATAY